MTPGRPGRCCTRCIVGGGAADCSRSDPQSGPTDTPSVPCETRATRHSVASTRTVGMRSRALPVLPSALLVATGCSSARVANQWRDLEYASPEIWRITVVGVRKPGSNTTNPRGSTSVTSMFRRPVFRMSDEIGSCGAARSRLRRHRQARGLGMGLSISRSIIEAHGGRLCASPSPGHGAVSSSSCPLWGSRVGPA